MNSNLAKHVRALSQKSIEVNGQGSCIQHAVEELLELALVLNRKVNRNRGTIEEIATEIADVEMMCDVLRVLVTDELVDKQMIVQGKKWKKQLEGATPEPEVEVQQIQRRTIQNAQQKPQPKIQPKKKKPSQMAVRPSPSFDDEDDLAEQIEAQRHADEEAMQNMQIMSPWDQPTQPQQPQQRQGVLRPNSRPIESEVFVYDDNVPYMVHRGKII